LIKYALRSGLPSSQAEDVSTQRRFEFLPDTFRHAEAEQAFDLTTVDGAKQFQRVWTDWRCVGAIAQAVAADDPTLPGQPILNGFNSAATADTGLKVRTITELRDQPELEDVTDQSSVASVVEKPE
jgi:hypothetical protein